MAMMLPSLVPMLQRYRRVVAGIAAARLGWLTAIVGTGYFFVWTVFGLAVFPVGVSLAEIEMREPAVSRAVPFLVGVTVLLAGALQFTPWKARQLACCRDEPLPNRGASPLGLPDTLSRSPLRRLASASARSASARPRRSLGEGGPFAWLARFARSRSGTSIRLYEKPSSFASAWRYGLRLGRDCTLCCAGLMAILLVAGVMDLWVMAAVTLAITAERVASNGRRAAQAVGAVAVGAGFVLMAQAF
jgi:predicted metal-binding membrane protein